MSTSRELHMIIAVRCQKCIDLIGFVGRQVVGDDMNLFAPGLVGHDVGEERDELGRGVPSRRLLVDAAHSRILRRIERGCYNSSRGSRGARVKRVAANREVEHLRDLLEHGQR